MSASPIDLTTATAVAILRQGDAMLKLSCRAAIALGGLKLVIGVLVVAAARGARRARTWEQGTEPPARPYPRRFSLIRADSH